MFGDRSTQIILLSGCIWTTNLASALAQLTPDNSLGDENSTVKSGATIDNRTIDLIEGGADRQDTLFHSFEEFNVSSGQQVYFANPGGIDHIVTRVTGSNISNILGSLGVNGKADLFLLNPNGLLFGENASLDIRGSFLGTTADGFVFSDGITYGATAKEVPPILKIQIPKGVQFGESPGSIEVRSTGHNLDFNSSTLMPTGYSSRPVGLQVDREKTLALIGGELNFNGGNITTSAGTIELAAIAQSGRVELDKDGKALEFGYDNSDYDDINFNSASSLLLNLDNKSASINLKGNNITLSGSSTIIARSTRPSKNSEINIAASDLSIINNSTDTFPSSIFTIAEDKANNYSAEINLEAIDLSLQNNALIVSNTTSKANAGDINIAAQQLDLIDTYELPYNAGIYSQALSDARGDVGIITIELNDLKLLEGQTFLRVDDEDDLENIIGEDRAEDLEEPD